MNKNMLRLNLYFRRHDKKRNNGKNGNFLHNGPLFILQIEISIGLTSSETRIFKIKSLKNNDVNEHKHGTKPCLIGSFARLEKSDD